MSPNTHGELTRLSDEEVAERLTDLHYVLLRQLPDEGQMHAFRPMTTSTRFVRDRLNEKLPADQKLSVHQVSAELRTLAQHRMVLNVKNPLGSDKLGWQRTRRAKELLVQYDEEEKRRNGSIPNEEGSDVSSQS